MKAFICGACIGAAVILGGCAALSTFFPAGGYPGNRFQPICDLLSLTAQTAALSQEDFEAATWLDARYGVGLESQIARYLEETEALLTVFDALNRQMQTPGSRSLTPEEIQLLSILKRQLSRG